MLIITGLGNPGEKYKKNFHNMGFRVVDRLCEKLGKKCIRAECNALTCVFSRNNEKIVIAKPLTYMNNSGDAVKELLGKYKATPSELLVIYDDIDLPRFTVRARKQGSGGTHNGMRSIISAINSTDFMRIRMGVGSCFEGELADYVLSDVASADEAAFSEIYDKVADKLLDYIARRDFDSVMRVLNTINEA